jgi:hypothetical protein
MKAIVIGGAVNQRVEGWRSLTPEALHTESVR